MLHLWRPVLPSSPCLPSATAAHPATHDSSAAVLCRSSSGTFPPVWMMAGSSGGSAKPHSFRDVPWMRRRWHGPSGRPQIPHFQSAWDRPRRAAGSASAASAAAAAAGCPQLPIDQDLTRVSQDEWAKVRLACCAVELCCCVSGEGLCSLSSSRTTAIQPLPSAHFAFFVHVTSGAGLKTKPASQRLASAYQWLEVMWV